MPSPERGPGGPSEPPRRQEQEPLPYQRVARFVDADVAVLGAPPPPALDAQLTALLATGEPATLPATVLQALTARRQQQRRRGSWVEGHYRPGWRL